MKIKNISIWLMGAVGLMAGGCSDSDDWMPGPEDTNVGVAAYFPEQEIMHIFGSDEDPDNMTFDVTVSRLNYSAAASVPVTITSDVEGFSAPAAVEFAEGEVTGTLKVSCAGIPKGTMQTVNITIAPDETDIYGPGEATFQAKAIISDWTVLADPVTYFYSDGNGGYMYPNTTGVLYHLQGTHMFRFTDFFGSGLDVNFEASSGAQNDFLPTNNILSYKEVWPEYEDTYNCYYLFNQEEQAYPVWTPGGASDKPAVESAMFYGSGYSTLTMVYNESNLYGYGDFTIELYLSDGSSPWGYWQLDFNMNYNPFE